LRDEPPGSPDSRRQRRHNFAGGFVRDRDGRAIPLRPQAFDLLKYLLQNAGRLVTKDELMKAVWPGVFVTDDSLVQCVREVRRAIRDADQSVLRAVPKRGYSEL
jgi:DNA-binding winged helix-turn-helix (wHTH) protein